jgi:hypothetical protein
MDGKSWKDEVINKNTDWSEDRCVYLEMDFDRAVVCGCHKVVQLHGPSDQTSGTFATGSQWGYSLAAHNFFDLCDATGTYVDSPGTYQENDGTAASVDDQTIATELGAIVDCYLGYTDPDVTPDYNVQCSNSITSTASPTTLAPSPEPTAPPPTASPSAGPTMNPSFQPSAGPTMDPSSQPSGSPTIYCPACVKPATGEFLFVLDKVYACYFFDIASNHTVHTIFCASIKYRRNRCHDEFGRPAGFFFLYPTVLPGECQGA